MTKQDIQEFFKLRMVEALHRDSLDSFRVRVNNAISIAFELSHILEGWLEGSIKRFETVEHCITEAKDLVEADECLVFPFSDKDILIQELNDYIGKSNKKNEACIAETKQLLFLINTLYSFNSPIYLGKCIEKIEQLLSPDTEIPENQFIPTIDEINKYISSLCCELLRLGYSKAYLYHYFKFFRKNKSNISFEDAFTKMKNDFLSNTGKDFTVIFKLEFLDRDSAQRATDKISTIREKLDQNVRTKMVRSFYPGSNDENRNAFSSYIIPRPNIRYYVVNKKALDAGAATRFAFEDLSNDLDQNLENIANLKMPSTALIIDGDFIRNGNVYYFDSGEDIVATEPQSLGDAISDIKQNTLTKDIQERLYSALRHLRIGDQQNEIEQRFINYWIALEFIFASPRSSESTFERIKKFLPEILGCCYVKRNILYMNKWLRGKKVLEGHISWNNLSDEEKEQITENVDILTRYRLTKLKSRLSQNEKTKEYIKFHKKNLESHITRIYRLRNELIHEAAIKQDIANLTSNLRFYLVFVLNQLISFLKEYKEYKTELDISHFFGKFHILFKHLTNEKKSTIDDLMNMISIEKYII